MIHTAQSTSSRLSAGVVLRSVRALVLAACLLGGPVASASAQSPAAPAAAVDPAAPAPVNVVPASAPPPGESSVTLLKLFELGGWTMWPLLFCSVAVVGFTVYNFLMLTPQKLIRPDVMNAASDSLRALDVPKALMLTRDAGGLAPEVLASGLSRIRKYLNVQSVESGIEESVGEHINSYSSTINYLSVIGVIAPMVGLLGTVSGMIKAFRSMALGGMGRPELLADNISEALITTAAGLIVGIPAMALYFFFKYRFSHILAAATRHCGEAVESLRAGLLEYEHRGTAEVAPAAPPERAAPTPAFEPSPAPVIPDAAPATV